MIKPSLDRRSVNKTSTRYQHTSKDTVKLLKLECVNCIFTGFAIFAIERYSKELISNEVTEKISNHSITTQIHKCPFKVISVHYQRVQKNML